MKVKAARGKSYTQYKCFLVVILSLFTQPRPHHLNFTCNRVVSCLKDHIMWRHGSVQALFYVPNYYNAHPMSYSIMSFWHGDTFRNTDPSRIPDERVDSFLQGIYADRWCYLWCQPDESAEQTAQFPVIWNVKSRWWNVPLISVCIMMF